MHRKTSAAPQRMKMNFHGSGTEKSGCRNNRHFTIVPVMKSPILVPRYTVGPSLFSFTGLSFFVGNKEITSPSQQRKTREKSR
jgi:hypothetical protein